MVVDKIKSLWQQYQTKKKEKYWRKRQVQFLINMIREDIHWLGTEGIHGTILQRYQKAIGKDWYQVNFQPANKLREELIAIPDEQALGYLRHYRGCAVAQIPRYGNTAFNLPSRPVKTPVDNPKGYRLYPSNYGLVPPGCVLISIDTENMWVDPVVFQIPGLLNQLIDDYQAAAAPSCGSEG